LTCCLLFPINPNLGVFKVFNLHNRYRGESEWSRSSQTAIAAFTDSNHSKNFNAAKFPAAQEALAKFNAPRPEPAPVVETDPRENIVREYGEREVARLLRMTVKALRAEASRAMLDGRSRMAKARLVEELTKINVLDFEIGLY